MITGHIVTYDNMGIAALIHPLACKARYTVSDCPMTHHLLQGHVEGRKGHGAYVALLRHDNQGPWVKLVPQGEDADTAHEIGDLLHAFLDEVGSDAGHEAIVEWIVAGERATLAAKTAKAR